MDVLTYLPLMCHLFGGSVTPFNVRELTLRDYWALRSWADEHNRRNAGEEE